MFCNLRKYDLWRTSDIYFVLLIFSSEMESDQIEEAEEEERVGRKKKGGKKMPKKCPLKTKKAKVPSEVPTAKLTPAAKLAKIR